MLTNDEKRMLRVVAAYNDITEEEAKAAIVKNFLGLLLTDESSPIGNMKLEHAKTAVPEEKIVKPRKKPGPKPKKQTVNELADEIEQTEKSAKMSREEFIEYFGGKQ